MPLIRCVPRLDSQDSRRQAHCANFCVFSDEYSDQNRLDWRAFVNAVREDLVKGWSMNPKKSAYLGLPAGGYDWPACSASTSINARSHGVTRRAKG